MGKGWRLACGLALAGAVACKSAGTRDDGGPGIACDGAVPSCPATYFDVPQFTACCGRGETTPYVSCDYHGQISCGCVNVSTNPVSWEWECMNFSCECSPDNDAGCVNKPCTTEADCPSGQHCGLGAGGNFCSVGCMGDGGNASCPAGSICTLIAP